MKHLLYFVCLCLFPIIGKASHIVGGDIYYDYLGSNQYRITVVFYRDCFSTGAAFDNPLNLGVFLTNSNARVMDIQIAQPPSTNIPVDFNNPCVIPPNNICTERAIYSRIVTLPPVPGGYTIAYQRCCRGPAIVNLVNPDDTGLTLVVRIPGSESNYYVNSSPRFPNYPPLLLCNNDILNFDHHADDPDGDQLVYSLATPYAGANPFNPMPVPIPAPPYNPVIWASNFSSANPLGPGASISINPTTGQLIADPNLVGLFVVGIRVSEYRGGVLINSTIRDFIFKVFNCNITMQAILPTQPQLSTFVSYCQGLTVQFENNSYGGTNYQWNFGDPTTTADNSTSFAPTYTYPDTGHYVAQLVVNPGWPCTDTAYMDLYLNMELNVSFTSDDSLCFVDNSYDFTGITDGPDGTTLSWNFGPTSNPTSATGINANGIHFASSGYFPVTVTANSSLCTESFTDTIYVVPEPIADFEMPINYQCDGLTIPFINNTENATTYDWNFGDGSPHSSEEEPTHTYSADNLYTVSLIAYEVPQCRDTTTLLIEVNKDMTLDFTHSPDQCITNNSFDFQALVSGPDDALYTWDFGSNASITSSIQLNVNGVNFYDPGFHTITLSGSFDDCIKSISDQVYLYRRPEVGFRLEQDLQCAPYPAVFTNLSSSETPLSYSWNFGDGETSSDLHPIHIYQYPGNYTVSLTIQSSEGCTEVLTLSNPDIIDVSPTPVASFMIDPALVDICNSSVQFFNQSQDASFYYYSFDDANEAYSEEENPAYAYENSGTHSPFLIASNEEGCSDTTWNTLLVEPFALYIPNAFTPDGNEYNNILKAEWYLYPEEWNFKVFNRWGELLFESNDPDIGWDGSYEGTLMQSGLYIYTLSYFECDLRHTYVEKTGHFSLLR